MKDKKDKIKNAAIILVCLIFILLFFIAFLSKPKISGYVVVEKSINYTQQLGWEINSSSERILFLEHPGDLKGIRVSGSLSNGGSARAYIENDDKRYLVFDSDELEIKEGIGLITGAAVSEDKSKEEEKDEKDKEENKEDKNKTDENKKDDEAAGLNDTEEINETEEPELNETEEETANNTITIGLRYKSGTLFDPDDDGTEVVTGAIDFTAEDTLFGWDANSSNLCTRWKVYNLDSSESTTVCYGAERCCNFIELSPTRDSWDEAFYLTYGMYGAGLDNKVSSQVVYVDYSLEADNPYSNVYYSGWSELSAGFYYEMISFEDICIETCLLNGFNESFYKIVFEVDNGDLRIDSIDYSIVEKVVNRAPVFLAIPNQTISVDSNLTIDLSKYASDPDNDSLTFAAYKAENISVLIDDDVAVIIPDSGFEGLRYMFFTANDGTATAVSNVFGISVAKELKPMEEKTVQVFAEIGKPVRWVKTVKLNESQERVTVNVTKGASNISVKKIIANQAIDVNENLVTVVENEVAKPLEDYNAYNAGITGGVVMPISGNGIISRLFGRGITGAATADLAIADVSVNLTETDMSQLIIEDNATEYKIEYSTGAPQAFEINISPLKKQLVISSSLPYQNVLSYTNIEEAPQEGIRLYWYVNESEYDQYMNISFSGADMSSERTFKLDITDMGEFYASFIDENNNSLIDKVQWVAPHLSNQTFEISIDILNVQSYPMVKGNWTVMFTTIGTSNLTVSAINETSYTEVYDDLMSSADDLEILELRCGNNALFNKYDHLFGNSSYILEDGSLIMAADSLNSSLKISSFFFEDYSCNGTGYYIVNVLTPGVHNQEFRFGIDIAYANNLANYAPITDIIVFSDRNSTKTYTVMAVS